MGNLNLIINNRTMQVEAFSLEYAYGGLLSGNTTERINKAIFKRASHPNGWGNSKAIKLQLEDVYFKKRLPSHYYSVWLTAEPIDESFMGSQLIITWFEGTPIGRCIEEIIVNAIKKINWELEAEDFDF